MEIQNVEIYNGQEWRAFVNANHDAIVAECGSVRVAWIYARQGGFAIGGGASPLFVVTFEM